MPEKKRFRVFATSRIGDPAENRLRERGYDLEVFEGPEAPPKKLIIEKVKSGIDGLITTLRDPIDAEIFEAGKETLKVVAQIAVGFDNINREDANRYRVPFTHTVPPSALISPSRIFKVMDLPAPLAPRMIIVWPASSLKLTSLSTTFSSKASET